MLLTRNLFEQLMGVARMHRVPHNTGLPAVSLFPQLPLARNDFLSSNFFGSANQDEGLRNAYAFFFFSVGNRHTIATHNLGGHAQ